jgi:hypothetical protein
MPLRTEQTESTTTATRSLIVKTVSAIQMWPVGFSSYSGSITLEEYGTNYGDRLKGSFSVQLKGSQQLCPTSECDVDKEITGSISGSFDGIITNYTPGN